ncbi:MAG: NAD(P)/FAD-dependent oxidoreductase [Verrucomicrobia bacterium]|nr:NAD(P)/FAD-dependent oxidoreductase [Verrucomicrobiota bacterium]
MNELRTDVLIVGSGTSAHYCAHELRAAGRRVHVAEEREFGGTCALRGCQPKKYLVANTEAIAMAGHLVGRGIESAPRCDWPALQALKNEFLDGIPEGTVRGFEEAGIGVLSGRARFVAEDCVEVGDTRVHAGHIVLATGSAPRRAEIPGAELARTSDDFLNLPTLPRRIVFIGGGYISFEFAHVAARAGAAVTILHRTERPLKAFDPDMVDLLVAATRHAGVEVVLNEPASAIEPQGAGYVVTGASGRRYEADLVIEASGRAPNLSVLEGDLGRVAASDRGVTVNEFLQSPTNPRVYAIGDVAATPFQLASVADKEGMIAAENIVRGNVRRPEYDGVASAVFTVPNLATVGLTEDEARRRGLKFHVHRGTTETWASSIRIGEKHAGYKILFEDETHRILGAHLLRHNASEVINVFALALRFGMTAHDLETVVWAYPTYTSDIKRMIRHIYE